MEPWLKFVCWGVGSAIVAMAWCGAVAAATSVWKHVRDARKHGGY